MSFFFAKKGGVSAKEEMRHRREARYHLILIPYDHEDNTDSDTIWSYEDNTDSDTIWSYEDDTDFDTIWSYEDVVGRSYDFMMRMKYADIIWLYDDIICEVEGSVIDMMAQCGRAHYTLRKWLIL